MAKGCENQVEVHAYESAQFDFVWKEWCESGHEYGTRDGEFLERGLNNILNFPMLVVKRVG